MVKKLKEKETPRIGKQILEDKLALEATMDDAHESELRDRVEGLEDKLGSKAWANELKEYTHLSKEKAKVDKKKAKELQS